MSGFCKLRKNNPFQVFAEYFDAVWHFTLAVKGEDFVSLEPSEMPVKHAYLGRRQEVVTTLPQSKKYNLRPRKQVSYKV